MSMMTPRAELLALLAAVKSKPEEDLPKLVLADWLQEQEHATDRARAEYVRSALAYNRRSFTAQDRPTLLARLHELWQNYPAWLGPLPAAGFRFSPNMTQGGLLFAVIDGKQFTSRKTLAVAGSEEYAWVAGLLFNRISLHQNRHFLRSSLIESLITLRYNRCIVEPTLVVDLACARGASNLKSLTLSQVRIGTEGTAALAGTREIANRLGNLRELQLHRCDIGGDAGFAAFCDSPALNALRLLDVSDTGLTIHSARAFADGVGLPGLSELNLGGNHVGPDGAIILVHKPTAGRLKRLNLRSNGIADYGAEAICRCDHLSNLTHLDLSGNLLTNRAAIAIAAARQFTTLQELNLEANDISEEGAFALAKSPHLGDFHFLNLSRNPIGSKATCALRERFGERVMLS